MQMAILSLRSYRQKNRAKYRFAGELAKEVIKKIEEAKNHLGDSAQDARNYRGKQR